MSSEREDAWAKWFDQFGPSIDNMTRLQERGLLPVAACSEKNAQKQAESAQSISTDSEVPVFVDTQEEISRSGNDNKK